MISMDTDCFWSKTRHDFDGYPTLLKKKKLHNPAWPLVHNAEDIWHTKRWTQGEGSRECCLRLLDEWGAPLAGSAFREEFKRFAIESDLVWLAQMARQYEVFCWGGGWLLKNNLKTPRPRQRCWRASLSWWSIGQDKAVEPPTLPKKNFTIQFDHLSTMPKTFGTPRGEHREKVEQSLVQDFLMKKGPRLWQVVL